LSGSEVLVIALSKIGVKQQQLAICGQEG